MKFDQNKAFPHPVLRTTSDDYLHSVFRASVDLASEEKKVQIRIEFHSDNEALLRQIAIGAAQYVVQISCRDTYFRKVISSGEVITYVDTSVDDLRGEVNIDTYIVSVKKIDAFSSADINPEFGHAFFSFAVGAVLAQQDTIVHFIGREYFQPVTSVFDLVKNDSLAKGEWVIGLDDDHVRIAVSPSMKESIDSARNNTAHRAVLLNSIYFSAVTHAVQRIKEYGGEDAELKWARVIYRQLHNMGLDLDSTDAYLLAQKLMRQPLRALEDHVFRVGE